MSLQQWSDNSWISGVTPSPVVVSGLLAVADREISDGSLEGISPDGRFEHAYNAVRSLAELALRAEGYLVPKGQRQHERTIESLKFTLGEDVADSVDFYDRCRRQRHKATYQRTGVAQQQDANELLEAARELLAVVQKWLEESHPDLVQGPE